MVDYVEKNGTTGNDSIFISDNNNVIVRGNGGADLLQSTQGSREFAIYYGGDGDDRINDVVSDNVTVYADGGNDTSMVHYKHSALVYGGAGDDYMVVGSGLVGMGGGMVYGEDGDEGLLHVHERAGFALRGGG